MNEADYLSIIFLFLMLLVFIDSRRTREKSDVPALAQPRHSMLIDHRAGWIFLPLALAIQLFAGSLFT